MVINMTQPSADKAFSNYRIVAKSVPDLSINACVHVEHASQVSRSPRETPTPSPSKVRSMRTRMSRHRRSRNSSRGSSLEALGYRYPPRTDTPMSVDDPYGSAAPYRRRVYTMPSSSRTVVRDPNTECYRIRSFSVTSRGGVVNLGDLMGFRSRSDVNMRSEGSMGSDMDFRDRTSSTGSTSRSFVPRYKVLIIGEEDVGKSSLIAQFMTSEYLTVRNAYASDFQDEGEEGNIVSILLDGEEAELECTELKDSEQLTEETFNSADAYIVSYSVTDRSGFVCATECLASMRNMANRQPHKKKPLGPGLSSKAVILVGNKSDLARKRTVTTEEGRSIANKYDVKFVETSVVIHHNVDELLVGTLSQVRLKARQAAALSNSPSLRFATKARGFVNRILEKCDIRFRSCENLHL